jgi:thymidylate synthase ThyX
MEVKLIASTKVGEIASKDDFELYGGRAAGVCYMSGTFDDLLNEDKDKTRRRIKQTKAGGHHSVYEHGSFSMYLDGIPKIVAMIINNEKQYTTSEKSARYTKMVLSPKEQVMYTKWVDIFKSKIAKLYQKEYPNFFTDSRIEKLAQENARYLTSVFTPTSMVYTTNYRQFNYIIAFLDKFVAKEVKNDFETKLTPYVEEFVSKLKELPYYDEDLTRNEKCRSISLLADDRKVEEYFGDVYATTYNASFAELAQAQRHRTINYTMRVVNGEFYVPEIIKDSESFTELWLSDLKELAADYPQATLLEINEMGTLDAFILKMKERKCTFAQLEINKICNEILKKYEYALRMKIHPRAEEIIQYTKGSRCTFPDFKCTAPCGFALGINEERKI